MEQTEHGSAAQVYLAPCHARLPGNACRLLRDGEEAFPAMLGAIEEAQESICLQTYMFLDDAVGRRFSQALSAAAARGVEVLVLYDAVGSFSTPRRFFEALSQAGIQVRSLRPLSLRYWPPWRRDHRKILVVDGQVAFTGGINLGVHWAPKSEGGGWRDDVLRIEGPAVAGLERRVRAGFRLSAWRRLGNRVRRLLPRTRGSVALSVLGSRGSIHRAYLKAIRAARVRIRIAAAYFVPDGELLEALCGAARRGVDVALLLSGDSDHPLVRHAAARHYGPLLEAGVHIYEWQHGVLHAKTAVVDGVWGTLGSFNLERFSRRFHHEANVVFEDPRLALAVERSLESDCRMGRSVTLDAWAARPGWRKLLEWFSSQVVQLL
jgi:cardiolipin synthase